MKRLLLALALLGSPALAAPPDLQEIRFEPHLGATLPMGAALRDETGRTETLASVISGLPLVLALGYFRCSTLCGVVRDDALGALERSGLQPGRDYRLLVLSIDPAETPADAFGAKQAALDRYPDGADWRFLTTADVTPITQAVGFQSRFDPASKQFYHPAGLVIASPAGVISNYLLGVGYDATDVRSAVLRANNGAVAEAVSPILLLCFHYDPTTGKYSLAIYRALSIMAGLTAITLGGMLLLAHTKGRRA